MPRSLPACIPVRTFPPESPRDTGTEEGGRGGGGERRWVPTLLVFVDTSLPPATVAAAACLLIDPAVVLSHPSKPQWPGEAGVP